MTLVRQDEAQLPVMRVEEDPVAVVERATRQANALMDVVEAKKQYVEIEGKKYLYVEAWEIIGAFNGVHAETEWVEPIKDENVTIGYTAKVNLIKNGEVVGSGVMPCGFEDFPCRGKEGMAKHKACQSAAQTWAESKAYRMNFSYVAVLGGYQPTPAEEMIGSGTLATASNKYLCPIHNVEWFKRGKMKAYAHPIAGDDKAPWCRMEQVLKDRAAKTPQVVQEDAQEDAGGPSEPSPIVRVLPEMMGSAGGAGGTGDVESILEVVEHSEATQAPVFANLGELLTWAASGVGLTQKLTKSEVASAAGVREDQLTPQTDLRWLKGQVIALYGKPVREET